MNCFVAAYVSNNRAVSLRPEACHRTVILDRKMRLDDDERSYGRERDEERKSVMILMDVVGNRSAVAVLNPLFLESKGGGPRRFVRSYISAKSLAQQEIRQIDTE